MAIARQRIHLPPKAWRRAIRTAASGSLSKGGSIDRFERAFADFMGVPEAVVVPSGRAGLRFIFEALGLEQGDEVICASFAYPVVPYLAGSLGYSVRFADVELDRLGMDPEALRNTISDKTKVVVATHLYGVPCRIREIAEIAEANGATLIEDCAHCLGASIGGQATGSFGSFGYFSGKMVEVLYEPSEVEAFFVRHPDSVVVVHEGAEEDLAGTDPSGWSERVVRDDIYAGKRRYLVATAAASGSYP